MIVNVDNCSYFQWWQKFWYAILYFFPESSLLSSLSFSEDDRWLAMFYSCLLKKVTSYCMLSKKISFGLWNFFIFKYDEETSLESKISQLEDQKCNFIPTESTLRNNTDLLTCKAEHYHACGEYRKCFELTSRWVSIFYKHKKEIFYVLDVLLIIGNGVYC